MLSDHFWQGSVQLIILKYALKLITCITAVLTIFYKLIFKYDLTQIILEVDGKLLDE